jgi:triosephosphate isomerase
MYKTVKEAIELVTSLNRELLDLDTVEVAVCPPYTALADVADALCDSNIKLGAQNVYWEDSGAFTGEVSPVMLRDIGCRYVIVGHSERRKYFGETNDKVNKRIRAAQSSGIIPIVCVGETLEEREAQKTIEVVQTQLEQVFRGLSSEQMAGLVIAYEPVWAIGTGRSATAQQAQEVQGFIRGWLKEHYPAEIAEGLLILYGGSVKPDNIKKLMVEKDIDGALVGGASLESPVFVDIVKKALEVEQ